MMRSLRVLAILALPAAAVGLASGCVWITEDEVAAFNDRDGDGVDHGEDCDDSNPNIQGTVKFYPDVDGDSFGDMDAQATEACPSEAPKGQVRDNTDCNDNNPNALPGGVEVCDVQNIDEDCDGAADDADADAEGKVRWYPDTDGDTYGDQDDPGVLACDPPTGTEVLNNTDCDDSLDHVNPDGVEVCDPDDNDEDCNGLSDDADGGVDPASRIQHYADGDSDGYGDVSSPGAVLCQAPLGQADNSADCDDADPDIHPGVTEVCDAANVDEDCNGLSDDADPGVDPNTFSPWFPDVDVDGFGDQNAAPTSACDPAGSQTLDNTDCDDSRADVSPADPEICDAGYADEDCDGLVNDLDPDSQQLDWWPDGDGDGYGTLGPPATQSCVPPLNHASQSGDCNDVDPNIHPGAKEYHDSIDSDCDVGATDFVCGLSYFRVGPSEVFTAIQPAINAVDQITYCDGDTIEVLPGNYVENLTIADKSPNLVGLVGPLSTTITGTGSTRVVTIDRSSTRLSGFRITGGSIVGDGGGIRVFYGDGVVIDNVVVEGNQATNGGGIELRNPTDVSVIGSDLRNNTTTTGDGGGIRVSATGASADGVILLSDLDVDSNVSGDVGGGIAIDLDHLSVGASVVIEDSLIRDNSAVTAGGLHALEIPWFELRNTEISGNAGLANHGGAQILDCPSLIEGVQFLGNTGLTVGGMQVQNYLHGQVTLRDVLSLDNTLTQADGNGHGILLKGDTTYGSTLQRVEAGRTGRTVGPSFAWGGELSIEGMVAATNLLIYDSSAPSGLFLAEAATGAPATQSVTNATVVGCDNDGIGIGSAVATSIDLVNVIAANNGGYGVNQILLNAAVGTSATWNNGSGAYNGTNHVGVNGNVDADPVFASFAGGNSELWDLHLGAGSACIDTGSAVLLDPDGTRSDMGVYGGPNAD